VNLWDFKLGKWRPVYAFGLFYLRYSPFDIFKDFLRHGAVGHTPRFVQFTNKDGIGFDLDVHECVQKAIFCFHYFEPVDVEAFRTFIKQDATVIDVGANIGQYSLLASKLMGQTGEIYAFEPSVDIQPKLKRNIDLNNFENIEVIPCAVAATSGVMKFYPANEVANQGVGSLMPVQEYRSNIRSNEGVDVDVMSLDDFCGARGIEKVDVLKIDVEGFDLEVLKGATKLMKNNPDLVIMSEVEPMNLEQLGVTAKDFYNFMESQSFHAWYAEKGGELKRLKGEKPPYHPNVFFRHERYG